MPVTATAGVTSSGLPRAVVAVNWTSPTPVPSSVTVWRIDPSGMQPVRGADPVSLPGGTQTVLDHEAPLDVPIQYRATAVGGKYIQTTVPLTLSSGGRAWLVHPGQPALSIPLDLVTQWPSWTRPAARGIFQPVGRRDPIVVSGLRQAESGDLSFVTGDASAAQAVERLLADATPLLLKGTTADQAVNRWVSIGDVEESPYPVGGLRDLVQWTLPLQVVSPPAGASLPPVTYAKTKASFTSYADAKNRAATYADRSAGLWS